MTINHDVLAARADRLRALHHAQRPLVLPNAWDAASARTLAAAGFPAVATGSHPVADSLGYPDGEGAPVVEMLSAAQRITRAVDIPVTVDLEAGYGMPPGELVERMIGIGAAGCNLEDTRHPEGTLMPVAEAADRIAAVREAARAAGVNVVVNARTDVYLDGRLPEDTPAGERLEAAVRRARAYLEAGADCTYPIMVSDQDEIAALTEAIPGPVNVLYLPGMPKFARLGELGVARVTFGGGLHLATMQLLTQLAAKMRGGEPPY